MVIGASVTMAMSNRGKAARRGHRHGAWG